MKKTTRQYRLGRREESIAETRARIVAAVVALHEEVGPRNTTIKAIAERAGVERLTVYRHFPDDRALYEACSTCWLESHPPPDPRSWEGETDAEKRSRAALTALNTYYRSGARMLRQIYHDVDDIPALAAATAAFTGYLEAVRDDLTRCWAKTGRSKRGTVAQTITHVLRFQTWDSLEQEGVDDTGKTALALAWIRAAAESGTCGGIGSH